MDEHRYIAKARAEIAAWEPQGPGYLGQGADFVLWPAEKAAELLIPTGAQEAGGKPLRP